MALTSDKNFYRSLSMLALPVIMQNIISLGVNLADGVMSGGLGDGAVSGVYSGGQVVNLLTVLLGGIDGTVLLLGARYYGAKQRERIGRMLGIALIFSSALALVFTAFSLLAPEFTVNIFKGRGEASGTGDGAAQEYLAILALSFIPYALSHTVIAALRSAESARAGMYISLSGLAVKLALNFVLMPNMQIKGAAVSTVVCRFAELIFALVYLFFFDKKTGCNLPMLIRQKKRGEKNKISPLEKEIFAEFVNYSLLIMGSQAVWAVNNLGGGAILGAHNNEASIAAVGIATAFNTVGFAIINGAAVAVGVIISKSIGEARVGTAGGTNNASAPADTFAKDRSAAVGAKTAASESKTEEYAKSAQLVSLVLGLLLALAMFSLKEWYLSLYRVSEDARVMASRLLSILSVTAAFTSYQSLTLLGIIKGSGRVLFTFITDAVSVLLVVLPSAYIAYRLGAPITVIFLLLRADQFLKCIPAALKANRKTPPEYRGYRRYRRYEG